MPLRIGPGGPFLVSQPITSQPVVVDEDSDWWAGAQQCFVGIAIAAAVAATSLSSALASGYQRQTDDVIPLASEASSFPASSQRQRYAPVMKYWYATDDLFFPPPPPISEEDFWENRPLPLISVEGILWATDEEIFPPGAAALDDGSWIQFGTAAQKIQVAGPQWDDGASGWLGVDEDYLWSAPAISRDPYRPDISFDDGSIPTISFAPEDDYWALPFARREAIPTAIAADEDFIRLAATPPEEEFWQWPAARIVPPVCNVLAADDEWIPSAVFTPTEEYWLAPPARLVTAIAAPWMVEDERPTPAVFTPSEDDGWQVVARPIAATLWVAVGEDEVAAAATGAYEDDSWQAPIFVAAKNQIQGPGWDDQVIYSLVDEDYYWVAAPIVGGVTRLPLWVDDEIAPKPFREEEYWFTARPYFDNLYGRVFSADDEVVPTTRVEDYWLILRPNFDRLYGRVLAADDEIVPQPIIATPSEGRTYNVSAENREYSIAPQDREYIVPAQNPKLEI